MKRLAWLTDIHLNVANPNAISALCDSVKDADAVLITGDIGEARDLTRYLRILDRRLGIPLYFVLGNHDYYRGSIAAVRLEVAALHNHAPRLLWLSNAGVIELTSETGLVGHDGWADGRFGDYEGSDIVLNDYFLIEELAGLDASERLEKLRALGDEAANYLRTILPEALRRYRHVIVLTHVPPFREACLHQGQIAGAEWLPHFASRSMGLALIEAMEAYPDREMTVLCGHTHSPGEAQILPNLRVLTGAAENGRPQVQCILDVE